MASRKIEDLHPDLQPMCRAFVAECKTEGIDVLVYCTYRSNAEQDDLYALGRTKPGKVVTKVPGGKSDHNFTINDMPAAKAFDAAPQRAVISRKEVIWNDPELWKIMGQVADRVGLKWGGNYKKFKDQPHFYI